MPKPLPSAEAALRGLFWKLMFRGRATRQGTADRRRQARIAIAMVFYVLLGIWPALAAFTVDGFFFACLLHGFTLMFASVTLASSAGSLLFMREESEILLHRPVRPQEVLRAKCAVLVGFSLLLALSMNVAGLITGTMARGSNLLFLPAHLFSTVMLMVFSAAATVLVYNLCLSWLGRDRFTNLLTTVQTLLTIGLIAGSQILPRVVGFRALHDLHDPPAWFLALPPVWFGSLDMVISGAGESGFLWIGAGLGLVLTLGTTWLAFVKLGAAYGQGMVAINEAPSGAEARPGRPQGRWLRRLVAVPPLSLWLRHPVERSVFMLCAAYMARDRETKLKLYPGLAPMLILPLVVLFSARAGEQASVSGLLQGFATCYLTIIPLQALALLQMSQQWRATDWFQMAPLDHWSRLFHGTRKAVLFFLAWPVLLLMVTVVAIWQRSLAPICLALPAAILLPVVSLVPGLFEPWIPFAKPPEDRPDTMRGCLLMTVAMGGGGLLGGLAWVCWKYGWFWLFLGLEIGLLLGVRVLFRLRLRTMAWNREVE